MRDDKYASARRSSNGQKALLFLGMVDIRKCCCERIVEHRGCFTEIDAMLPEIGLVLPGIPGEIHAAQYKCDAAVRQA